MVGKDHSLKELKECIGRYPDETRISFGCPEECNPFRFLGIEKNGKKIHLRFPLTVYKGRKWPFA